MEDKIEVQESVDMAKLKNEQQQMQQLRNEMVYEINIITKLIKQGSKKWNKMFADKPDQKDTFMTIWQAFEWANDAKDALISELVKTLNIRQDISFKAFCETNNFISSLLTHFRQITDAMQEQSINDNLKLYTDALIKLKDLGRNQEQETDQIKTILFVNSRLNHRTHIKSIAGQHINQRDASHSLNQANLALWIQKINDDSKDLLQEFVDTIHEYTPEIRSMKKKEKGLNTKVNDADKLIVTQREQINIMNANISKMKIKLADEDSSVHFHELADLQAERKELMSEFIAQQNHMGKYADQTADNLKHTVIAGKKANETLEMIKQKGEKLVWLYSRCMKLMTVEEHKWKKETFKKSSKWLENKDSQIDNEFRAMRFFNEYSKIDLKRTVLCAQRDHERDKNKEMKITLKTVFTSMQKPIPK